MSLKNLKYGKKKRKKRKKSFPYKNYGKTINPDISLNWLFEGRCLMANLQGLTSQLESRPRVCTNQLFLCLHSDWPIFLANHALLPQKNNEQATCETTSSAAVINTTWLQELREIKYRFLVKKQLTQFKDFWELVTEVRNRPEIFVDTLNTITGGNLNLE